VTLEPTVVEAGSARNQVPGRAWVNIDVRTNPGEAPDALFERLRSSVTTSELRLRSSRLAARETASNDPIVRAALDVSGRAPYGSRGLSDWCGSRTFPP
jgi:acetylornithine deacetylase